MHLLTQLAGMGLHAVRAASSEVAHAICPGALLLTAVTIQCHAQTNVSTAPSADAFVLMQQPAANFGSAGALNVSGSAATNSSGNVVGLCSSLVRFPMTNALAVFNTAFGANGWSIVGAVLQLNENASPDNPIFGEGVGAFEIDWIASGSWIEGTGTPRAPTTDGVAWQDLASILQPGTVVALGQFTNTGLNGFVSFNLQLAAPLISNILAGSDINFYLSAASDSVGFTFNSRNFGNTNDQPALILTATRQNNPVSLVIAPSGPNQIAVTFAAVSNRIYELQAAGSLATNTNAAWTTVFTCPFRPTNGQVTFMESATNRQRFYRLSVTSGP